MYRSDYCVTWKRQKNNLLQWPGKYPTDRVKGSHPDVVLSGGRAFLFYLTHQTAEDCEADDPYVTRRTMIQVVELEYRNGELACDRDQPTRVRLEPGSGE